MQLSKMRWAAPPPGFVLSLTRPAWMQRVGAGDGNRQVFRCVMFDMLTQHALVTGRRRVWQQILPDHDYIISVCLLKVRGEPQLESTTTHTLHYMNSLFRNVMICGFGHRHNMTSTLNLFGQPTFTVALFIPGISKGHGWSSHWWTALSTSVHTCFESASPHLSPVATCDWTSLHRMTINTHVNSKTNCSTVVTDWRQQRNFWCGQNQKNKSKHYRPRLFLSVFQTLVI